MVKVEVEVNTLLLYPHDHITVNSDTADELETEA